MISGSQRKAVYLILQDFIFLFHMMLFSTKRNVAATLMRHEFGFLHTDNACKKPRGRTKWVPVFPGTLTPLITATA
jgi:hypothetical protein